MEFKITTADKPKLEALLKSDKRKAMEVIKTFVDLIEESLDDSNTIPWVDLPQLFAGKNLTLSELVKGILHGALDLKDLNPDTYEVMKEEVHPLSMLIPRKNFLTGENVYHDWRRHFGLPEDTQVNQQTIETIFRKMLRYYKYVDIEALAHALINNQIKTFEGLGERNVQTLPFIPALRYQQRNYGDLHVGKMYDFIGFFDCGEWMDGESEECPACQHKTIEKVGAYKGCLSCNAGFKEGSL